MIINETFGQRIKQRREQLNISAVELGETVGLTKATIHRYESGEIKNLKLAVVESIASALKVNPDWLIGKTDDMRITSTSTNDDEKDVYEILMNIIESLDMCQDLTYKNKKMSDEMKFSLKSNIDFVIKIADKLQS